MECTQSRIFGGGSGAPGPTVKISGLYTAEEVNFDMWTASVPETYAMPGPAVWTAGESSTGTAASSGNLTSGDLASVSSTAVASAPA